MKASEIETPLDLLREALRHLQIISDHPRTYDLVTKIEDYFMEKEECGCEGSCPIHLGEVKEVYLTSEDGRYDRHPFTYCELAVMIDEESGFLVEE